MSARRIPAQYRAAAARRQAILDYLACHPGARMGDIGAWLAARGDHGSVGNTVRTLIDWNEARFEGNSRTRSYYAIARTTRSAEECCQLRDALLAQSNAARADASGNETTRRRPEPWRFIHRASETPIPNQGGQGALRQRVHVGGGACHV